MGLRYQRYRNSALASWKISDAFSGLCSSGYLTPDVESAARIAPLCFHPKQDPFLFGLEGGWWRVPHDTAAHASNRINQKFNGWYSVIDPVQKAYLTMIGLMSSGEFIDEAIDRVCDKLCERHRWTIIDGDDTIEEIEDQKSINDPVNIAAVLELPELKSACLAVTQQVKRMIAAPTADIAAINDWHKGSVQFQKTITDYFHSNIFARTGIKPNRARKAIAKSYDLLKQFVGKEAALAFIHGKELLIPARNFVWGLTLRPGEIIEKTIDPSRVHTPFKIQLYEPGGAEVLCTGCVLWPGTPVLDQAVGFILSTADPEEEIELLSQMNLQTITDAARENKYLGPKIGKDDWWDEPRHGIINLREEADAIDIEEIVMPAAVEIGTTEHVLTEEWVAGEPLAVPDERLSEGLDDDISDEEFEIRWVSRITNRRVKHKLERDENPLTQRIKGMLFDRIDAPNDILEHMANPGVYYWLRDNITADRLPEHVVKYVTEKRFV